MNGIMVNNAHGDTPVFPLPFTLFMGPQRAGTSWLYRYLLQHNQVCISDPVKEIYFFDKYFDRGLDFYTGQFHPGNENKTVIEISTTYFDHPEAPQRVLETFGQNISLICPLRHPIDRSYSLYKHFLRYGLAEGSLQEAVQQKPEIVTSSHYAQHIQNWQRLFGQNAIRFSFQEHLDHDQDGYVRQICEYLNIPFEAVPNDLSGRYNAGTKPPSYFVANAAQRTADMLRDLNMNFVINSVKALGVRKYIFGDERPDKEQTDIPGEDLKFLQDHLGDEVQKLEQLLGYDISYWKS